MSKNTSNFSRIMDGLNEVSEIEAGRATPARVYVPGDVDVKAIRQRTGLNQRLFADRYGFTLGALRDWEQQRRRPEAAARLLLKVIDREPEAVERALAQ